MTRRCFVTFLLVVVLTGCNRGSGKAPGLEDAGPYIAKFVEAGKALEGLGESVAALAAEGRPVSADYDNRLRKLGVAGFLLLSRAEPEGRSGARAIEDALAGAETEVVTHLVQATGAINDGPNILKTPLPDQVKFAINVPFSPYGDDPPDRSEQGKLLAKSELRNTLSRQIKHFVYAALLADPSSRSRFAAHRSPEDLPEVGREMNLSVATRDEWRDDLFDGGHLVLPGQFDTGKWASFLTWVSWVNPTLLNPVDELSEIAVRELYI